MIESPLFILASSHKAWYFLYLVNLLIAIKGWVFAGHFWSLSVEEHFYFIWPLIIYFFKEAQVIKIIVGIILISLISRFLYVEFSDKTIPVYVFTLFRLDPILVGSLISIIYKAELKFNLYKISRFSFIITSLIWILFILVFKGYPQYPKIIQTIGYFNTSIFYGSLLILVMKNNNLKLLFSNKILTLFGKYSYSIYIFHVFIIIFLSKFFCLGQPEKVCLLLPLNYFNYIYVNYRNIYLFIDASLFIFLFFIILSIITSLSWKLIEKPFLTLKKSFK